jgi:hypothetical protein
MKKTKKDLEKEIAVLKKENELLQKNIELSHNAGNILISKLNESNDTIRLLKNRIEHAIKTIHNFWRITSCQNELISQTQFLDIFKR